MRKLTHCALMILLCLTINACSQDPESARNIKEGIEERVNDTKPLQQLMTDLDQGLLSLKIGKGDRTMSVLVGDSVIKTYPVVLGQRPDGDKMMEGDKRTPEGTFTFRDKYPHASWHKFVWVDYPNAASWSKFNARKESGEIPESSRIGGEIGIHGVPDGKDHWVVTGEDWTLGCIAMRNSDLDEIYQFIVPKKTQLVISP